MNKKAPSGQLDPTFGNGGFAALPLPEPIQGKFLAYRNGYAEHQGTVVYYGLDEFNDLPVEMSRFYLSRLAADGKSHVNVPIMHVDEQIPGCYDFVFQQGEYTDGSAPLGLAMGHHPTDNEDWTQTYIVIGRFDQAFQPHAGFGDRGISMPKPSLVIEDKHAERHKDPSPEGLLNADLPRGAVIGDRIRAVFRSRLDEFGTTIQAATVLASFNTSSGQPMADLGENHDKFAIKLPDQDGEALVPHGTHFYSDGSFLLVGTTSRNTYLQRFHANGLEDWAFAGGKPIVLERRLRLQLVVTSQRIVVVGAATINPPGGATRVWAYTPAGLVDGSFNQGQVLLLSTDPESSLVLDHAAVDSEHRLVLTGSRWSIGLQQRWHATRVLENGSLDDSFADGGHFYGPEGNAEGTDLLLQGNDIRIACSVAGGSEQIAKLTP